MKGEARGRHGKALPIQIRSRRRSRSVIRSGGRVVSWLSRIVLYRFFLSYIPARHQRPKAKANERTKAPNKNNTYSIPLSRICFG